MLLQPQLVTYIHNQKLIFQHRDVKNMAETRDDDSVTTGKVATNTPTTITTTTTTTIITSKRQQPRMRRTQFYEYFQHRIPQLYDKSVDEALFVLRERIAGQALELVHGGKFYMPKTFPGLARLHIMERDFNRALKTWEQYQTDVWQKFLNIMLPRILGADRDTCTDIAMKAHKWHKIFNELLVTAFRGSGKSTCLAVILACCLKCIPGFNCMLYSGKEGKSIALLGDIYQNYLNIAMADEEYNDNARSKKTKHEIVVGVADPNNDGDDDAPEGQLNIRRIQAASSLSETVSSSPTHSPSPQQQLLHQTYLFPLLLLLCFCFSPSLIPPPLAQQQQQQPSPPRIHTFFFSAFNFGGGGCTGGGECGSE
jgi:hypothetical protein